MTGIYKFENILNRKVYIGQSVNIEKRYKAHINAVNRNDDKYLYRAIRKYGLENFRFDIIHECPKEQLNYWEKFYIKYYCSNNDKFGYNCNKGGDAIHNETLTDEHKNNISKSLQGICGHPAWNKNLPKELQPGYGKKYLLGKQLSEEWKANIGKGVKGNHWTMSDRGRKNISDSHKGHIPWNKGKKGLQSAWNKGMNKEEMNEYIYNNKVN